MGSFASNRYCGTVAILSRSSLTIPITVQSSEINFHITETIRLEIFAHLAAIALILCSTSKRSMIPYFADSFK